MNLNTIAFKHLSLFDLSSLRNFSISYNNLQSLKNLEDAFHAGLNLLVTPLTDVSLEWFWGTMLNFLMDLVDCIDSLIWAIMLPFYMLYLVFEGPLDSAKDLELAFMIDDTKKYMMIGTIGLISTLIEFPFFVLLTALSIPSRLLSSLFFGSVAGYNYLTNSFGQSNFDVNNSDDYEQSLNESINYPF